MVDTLWPANAVTGSPSYAGRRLRQTGAPGFAGATAARPLGARSGVRPGTSVATVTATSTTWTCGPLAGVADLETAAEAGPYQFAFDANATGAVTAANATNPRKDIIYVQIDDPAESDGTSTPNTRRAYLAGTAAGIPVAPAAPARSFVIAEINVPVSGGGTPTVTWVAPYAVAAGAAVPFLTQAQMLAWTPSIAYQPAVVFADPTTYKNGNYVWNGTAWKPDTLIDGGAAKVGTYDGISPIRLKVGSGVAATTDASSVITFAWPSPFALCMFGPVAISGDAGGTVIKEIIDAGSTLTNGVFQCLTGNGGAIPSGTSVRVHFVVPGV